MAEPTNNRAITVKVYHGYGHQHNLVVYGHTLGNKPTIRKRYTTNIFTNIIYLAKLFFIEPIPNVAVQLQWNNQLLYGKTEADGFFKFEWQSTESVPAGWHELQVNAIDEQNQVLSTGIGKIFIPHATQYGFISDIDDTVLVSHSATTGKKLKTLFTKNPRSRKTFADVVKFYHLLASAHTEPLVPNPFFYVSSSEWNLYDDLNDFFKHNGLPKGAFMLSAIKKWYQLLQSGKSKHFGKLIRVVRILEAFPKQRFILLGDNSQSDTETYVAVANKYPNNVSAIYIRNISPKKAVATDALLATLKNKAITTCHFKHTDEAILHATHNGLIV
jgi:phosphatidate phosphatase APP1